MHQIVTETHTSDHICYTMVHLDICLIHCGIDEMGLHGDIIKSKLFSALLALCAENSPVAGEFPSQRASNSDFDVSLILGHMSC